MTADDPAVLVAAIRAKHAPRTVPECEDPVCWRCSDEYVPARWPCDAARAADMIERLQANLELCDSNASLADMAIATQRARADLEERRADNLEAEVAREAIRADRAEAELAAARAWEPRPKYLRPPT